MAKILLVEDDNNLREIYEARLQAEGYTIVAAHDGEEALVIAKAEKPDLVISDVMMPKISGFEMLDILRNTDGLKEVKVIMLTALGQSDDQQRADKLGADRYLVKSQVTLEDIVKTAHELLGETDEAAAAVVEAATSPATPAQATPSPVAQAEPAPAVEPRPAPETVPAAAVATEPAAPTPPPMPSPEPEPTAPAPTMPVASDPSPAPAVPSPAPVPEPAQPVVPTATPSAPPVAPEPAANDDQIMSDAVDKLTADTDKDTQAAKPQPKNDAATTEPAEDTAKPTAKSTEPDDEDDEDDSSSAVKIANKKVITPIKSEEKDLNKLLEEEEAKEAAKARGVVAPPSDSDLKEAEALLAKAADNGEAASTAAEEAAIDAKIEDFVAGASSDPGGPETPKPTEGSAAPQVDTTEAPDQTESAPAVPPSESQKEGRTAVTSAIKPIVVSDEDLPSGAPSASLSGNPGVPPPSEDTKPIDPNSVAL